MFLTCHICKHSTSFLVSEGAPEDNLYKCRKDIPVSSSSGSQPGDFPVVEADWECNEYQKEMGS